MKSAHGPGCGARRSKRCDCRAGRDRRVRQRAVKRLKRQRQSIAERTGLPFEDTLMEICNCGCGQSVAFVDKNWKLLVGKLNRTPDRVSKRFKS